MPIGVAGYFIDIARLNRTIKMQHKDTQKHHKKVSK
jgi:hypothetical protein